MLVYLCVYAHTHTHCRVFGCEPRGRDETPGWPEESRWTKSRHTRTRICVQSIHLYVYARWQDAILDLLLFFLNMSFLPKKKSKRCERKTTDNRKSEIDLSAWVLNQGH